MIEKIKYNDWEHNVRLSNGIIELVATLDVGPRIIRFGFPGEANFFKEFPEELGKSGEKDWKIRGGHRFWHAPEAIPRTYVLDNSAVSFEKINDFTMRLIPSAESKNGIQREIEINMDLTRPFVSLAHRITNIGLWPIEVSGWALSAMTEGGIAVIPLPLPCPHSEYPGPAYQMSIWSYSDMSDPRLNFQKGYLLLDHAKAETPHKLGISVSNAWVAYAVNGMLFIKNFGWSANRKYPDGGCNFESYSEKSFIELESLGPLTLLKPGETVEHLEQWSVYPQFNCCPGSLEFFNIVKQLVETEYKNV
jgi:hypothetical protein